MDWEGEGGEGWDGVEVWERDWEEEGGRRVRRFASGKVEEMVLE